MHRTHLAEIQNLLLRLGSREIGDILEALSPMTTPRPCGSSSPPDARTTCCGALRAPARAPRRHPPAQPSPARVNAYEIRDGRLRQLPITGRRDMAGLKPLWVDLLDATPGERRYVGEHFGVHAPRPQARPPTWRSAPRFIREEDGEIRLHSNFLLDRAGESRSVPVVFVLRAACCSRCATRDLPAFRLQRRRAITQPIYTGDSLGLLGPLRRRRRYSADAPGGHLRRAGPGRPQGAGENLSDEDAASMLATIADEEDLNGRIRKHPRHPARRLLPDAQPGARRAPLDDARQVLRDIESLNNHTAFLFDKINFLMDATIGFININQNRASPSSPSSGWSSCPSTSWRASVACRSSR